MAVRLEKQTKDRPSLTPLFRPLAVLATLIIANLMLFRFGYPLVSGQLEELSEKKELTSSLEAKVQVLSDIDPAISSNNESLIQALPSKNPALFMLNQIDLLVNDMALTLEDTSVGSELKPNKDMSQVLISATVGASSPGELINFASRLSEYSPLNTVQSVQIKQAQGNYSSVVETYIFWSELPTVIGLTTQPVSRLTSQEQDIVKEINLLQKPRFETITPQNELPRINPFN